MDFYPDSSTNENRGEDIVWDRIRQAFVGEEGVAYANTYLYTDDGLAYRAPDILVVSRRFGVLVLEAKGCRVNQVARIDGRVWTMQEWYRAKEQPVHQANSQMFAAKHVVDQIPELRGRVAFNARVVLPFVARADWNAAGYGTLADAAAVLSQDELTPAALVALADALEAARPYRPLDDREWTALLARFSRSDAALPPVGRVDFLAYTGDPPSRQALAALFPRETDAEGNDLPRSYTYLTATAALEEQRLADGFSPDHQLFKSLTVDSEPPERVQLRFPPALRHFLFRELGDHEFPLMRTEERLLLARALRAIAPTGPRAHQLRQDLFSWLDALDTFYEAGESLAAPPSEALRNRLVHPRLADRVVEIEAAYQAQRVDAAPARLPLAAAARAFLVDRFVPTPLVLMEGFSRLTPLQQLFVVRCAAQGARVVILHPYRPEQAHGFEAMVTTYASFRDDDPDPVATEQRARPPDLDRVRSLLFSTDPHPPLSPARDGSVTVEGHPNRAREVTVCIDRVLDALTHPTDPLAPGQIGILVRDRAAYLPLLREEAELRAAEAKGRGVADFVEAFGIPPRQLLLTPVGRFILTLYDVWRPDGLHLSPEQFETILASGWLGADKQATTDVFTALKAQAFARADTRAQWSQAFDNLAALADRLADQRRQGTRMAAGAIVPSAHGPAGTDYLGIWREAVELVTQLCTRLFAGGDKPIQRHIEDLRNALDALDTATVLQAEREVLARIEHELVPLLQGSSVPVSATEVGDVLHTLVHEREAAEGDDPPPGRLLVTGPEGIDSASRPLVCYLGCSDRALPRPYADPWPIQEDRVAEHQQQERYLFLAAVRAAGQQLHLSFPRDEGGRLARPSIYLDDVAALLDLSLSPPERQPVLTGDPLILAHEVGATPRPHYAIEELAHFALCPYRYELERLDDDARRYEPTRQVQLSASGRWLDLLFGHLAGCPSPSRGAAATRRWLEDARDATLTTVQSEYPGFRDLDWNVLHRNVTGHIDYLITRWYPGREAFELRVEDPGPRTYVVPDVAPDRAVEVRVHSRHVLYAGHVPHFVFEDLLREEWLRYLQRPDDIPRQSWLPYQPGVVPGPGGLDVLAEVGGVPVFSSQYAAVQWWRGTVEDRYAYDAALDLRVKERDWGWTLSAGQLDTARRGEARYPQRIDQLRTLIRHVEAGRYPKHPGPHCQYCPVQGLCLGIGP